MKSNSLVIVIHQLLRLTTILCFLCYSFLQPSCAIAATEFKIIDLQHRFVEDILPIIEPLTGSDGAVTGIQNHLIIRASPEKMLQIEQVILTLDVVRQNLKISIRHQNNQQSESSGVSVNSLKRFGNMNVSTQKNPRTRSDGVHISAESNQSKTITYGSQFINVIDGESAFIRVGQSIPFTQEWVTLTQRYVSVKQTTEFVNISTGFSVRPRSIGNQVELKVTPRISQLNQQGIIDFKELSTIVIINRGEWLDLGTKMFQKDEVSREILSKKNNNQSQQESLSILVE